MAFTWSNAITAGTNAERQDIEEIKTNTDLLKDNLAPNTTYNTSYNTGYQTAYHTSYCAGDNTANFGAWNPY